jgi:protein-disulfide isomerase
LPDLEGHQFDLESMRGQETALIFWNPGCGFCSRMLDDIKAWESSKPESAPALVFVSTGAVDANQRQGLTSPVLLDQGFKAGRSFGASGTPSAVLVDADGKIASQVAVGAPGVFGLLGRA